MTAEMSAELGIVDVVEADISLVVRLPNMPLMPDQTGVRAFLKAAENPDPGAEPASDMRKSAGGGLLAAFRMEPSWNRDLRWEMIGDPESLIEADSLGRLYAAASCARIESCKSASKSAMWS